MPFSFLSYTNFSLLLLLLLLLQTLLLLLKLFDCLNSINKLRKFFLKKIWYRLRINYLEVAISPLTFFFLSYDILWWRWIVFFINFIVAVYFLVFSQIIYIYMYHQQQDNINKFPSCRYELLLNRKCQKIPCLIN